MSKKTVAVYTGMARRSSLFSLDKIVKQLRQEGVVVRKYAAYGPLRVCTPAVDIRIVCHGEELYKQKTRFDEVFNFDPYVAIDLRKNHHEEGYSGGLIQYVIEENNKLGAEQHACKAVESFRECEKS